MPEKELLKDPSFQGGFALLGINPAKDGRKIFRVFGKNPAWQLAEWWTPYPFKDAPLIETQHGYEMANESRRVAVDTAQGRLTMELDSEKEYAKLYQGVRHDSSQGWSHLLIEQDFEKPAKLSELKGLVASLAFQIDECQLFREKEYSPDRHAAQFLWYITLREGPRQAETGPNGNYIWFGLPLFDNRFEHEEESAFYDLGNEGSTKKLIYGMASKKYLKDKIELGKEVRFSIDLLPDLKKAVAYAIGHGIFASADNLYVNYMNLGWELPGNFRVASTLRGLSLRRIDL
jgi:hypothetical protein